jgi:hypothetical protein
MSARGPYFLSASTMSHFYRHCLWTYFKEPEHPHGEMSFSRDYLSDWKQNLHRSSAQTSVWIGLGFGFVSTFWWLKTDDTEVVYIFNNNSKIFKNAFYYWEYIFRPFLLIPHGKCYANNQTPYRLWEF